jgi:hypothetical protein
MSKQAIEFETQGIKCDAPNCSYSDMTVPLSELESYLDKPCPLCAAPLMTKEDLAVIFLLIGEVRAFNVLHGEVPEDSPRTWVELTFDGSGTFKC